MEGETFRICEGSEVFLYGPRGDDVGAPVRFTDVGADFGQIVLVHQVLHDGFLPYVHVVQPLHPIFQDAAGIVLEEQ